MVMANIHEPSADVNPEVEAELVRLAALSPLAYDKARAEAAKRLGVTLKILDSEVKSRQTSAEVKNPKELKKTTGRNLDGFVTDGKTGAILTTSQHNIRLALKLAGMRRKEDGKPQQFSIRYDLFAQRIMFGEVVLSDADVTKFWLQCDLQFKFRPPKELFQDVLMAVAHEHAYHPVVDYLAQLQWDGVPRVDTWLVRYGGAVDTPYVRAVGRKTLIAAVRRVRQPGCKFDTLIVLEGVQGKNKSSALCTLAVKEEWFSDSLPAGADDKKVIEHIAGKWVVEWSDLSGYSKSEIEKVKAMLSRRHDEARLSHARLLTRHPRQCVFFGTTNDQKYLRDQTGNRRFWPVWVPGFDLVALAADRDQLWAEAAALEASGESITLPEELWAEAASEQEKRLIAEPWFELLAPALDGMEGKVSTEDIWSFVGVDSDRRTQEHNRRLGSVMTRLGWENKQARIFGIKQYCYTKGNAERVIQLSDKRLVYMAAPGLTEQAARTQARIEIYGTPLSPHTSPGGDG